MSQFISKSAIAPSFPVTVRVKAFLEMVCFFFLLFFLQWLGRRLGRRGVGLFLPVIVLC